MELDSFVSEAQIIEILNSEDYIISILDGNYPLLSLYLLTDSDEKMTLIECNIGYKPSFLIFVGKQGLQVFNYKNEKMFDIAIPDKFLLKSLNYALNPKGFFENLDFILTTFINEKSATYSAYVGEPLINGAFSESFSNEVFKKSLHWNEVVSFYYDQFESVSLNEGGFNETILELAALNGDEDAESIIESRMGKINPLIYFVQSIDFNEGLVVKDDTLTLVRRTDDLTVAVIIPNERITPVGEVVFSTNVNEYPYRELSFVANILETYYIGAYAE